MNHFTKEDLIREYYGGDKTMKEVGQALGVAAGTVYNYFKKWGLEPRKGFTEKGRASVIESNRGHMPTKVEWTDEMRHRLSEAKRGKFVKPSKYGGHTKKHPAGYVMVYAPDNHRATAEGYVMEHILVAEEMLGRPLTDDECVHHINWIKDDNRTENLRVMTKSEHMSYHMNVRHGNIEKGEMAY